MFFSELEAADKRISHLREMPLHRRGLVLDAYREECDPAAIIAVDVDYDVLHEPRADNGRKLGRGKVFREAQ